MAKLRVHNLAMSLDGFVAGRDQSVEDPLGVRGQELHEWVFKTRSGLEMLGQSGGETGLDDDFLVRGTVGIGATIVLSHYPRESFELEGVVPVVLGAGERIFEGPLEGYQTVELVSSSRVAHVVMTRMVT